MGYFTKYKLEVKDDRGLTDELREFYDWVENNPETPSGYPLIEFVKDTADTVKWYDHEEEMRGISKYFPNLLFILSGKGEEPGDLWFKYFRNGKLQRAPAIITYDECNI